MPTDNERREVARKLRELASENQGTLGSMRKMQEVMTQAQKITGTMHLPSVAHVLERYADLIEPQERTCRIFQAYGDEGEELDHRMEEIAGTPEDTVACICQSCGHEFRYERMVRPRFCPNCGARNVTEVD